MFINGTQVCVKVGDIFEEEGLKVIGVNEYFDYCRDWEIITENLIHGKYIKRFGVYEVEFESRLYNDSRLNQRKTERNEERAKGRKQKYCLGSIFKDGEFLLTFFSKFDAENRAYLYLSDYFEFFFNFWNELDIIYGNRRIALPLLGTGITRFKPFDNLSEQELLKMMLLTFKLSKLTFKKPAELIIIIHKDKARRINFSKLL